MSIIGTKAKVRVRRLQTTRMLASDPEGFVTIYKKTHNVHDLAWTNFGAGNPEPVTVYGRQSMENGLNEFFKRLSELSLLPTEH